MIQIINYNVGNLGSVQNMLKRLGIESRIVNSPSDLSEEKLILPGVGSFDTGMTNLSSQGWVGPLTELVIKNRIPALGICLGMQLMLECSQEGKLPGLSWVEGEVIRFPDKHGLKIPHMGWNVVKETGGASGVLGNGHSELRFYFVHSYFVRLTNSDYQIGQTHYGSSFTSAFKKNNLFGVQFHPEKSHKFGMTLLNNFASYEYA